MADFTREDIEERHQRRVRRTIEEGMMQGRSAEEIAKKVREEETLTTAELRKQTELSSSLLGLRKKYKDDSVALVKNEDELIKRLERQREQLEYQDKITGQNHKDKLDGLREEIEEVKNHRKELLANMSMEERAYALLMEKERDRADSIKKTSEAIKRRITLLEDEYKNASNPIRKKEIGKELDNLRTSQQVLDNNAGGTFAQALGHGGAFMKSVGSVIDLFTAKEADKRKQSILDAFEESGQLKSINHLLGKIADEEEEQSKDNKDKKDKGLDSTSVLEKFTAVMSAFASVLNSYVDNAAQFLTANQGITNAALYGYNRGAVENGNWFEKFNDNSKVLASSTLLSQQTYLQNITNLARQGIADGVETAALLTSVAEKTVPQFNATSGYLRRLVLLQEKDATQKFFGLEAVLQKSLNAQFGESSYLNQLFESVNTNLTDAITNLAGDLGISGSYEFTSSVQNWLSTLYEQGVDTGTINRISSAINALGSGNISAMSSDAGMQKLVLLAMDRVGQDYASILQEGLSAESVNILLGSMVQYLKDVANTTKSNNVLESAYSNLFGLSMTDMYALSNVQTPSWVNTAISGGQASSVTAARLGEVGTDGVYITMAERINNLLSNLQFDFGSEVAGNSTSYLAFKAGNLALSIGEDLGKIPMVGKAAGKAVQMLGAVTMGASIIPATVGVIKDLITNGTEYLTSGGQNSVLSLYQNVVSGETAGIPLVETNFKSIEGSRSARATEVGNEAYKISEEDITAEYEKEDPSLTILKEFEKTFMKNKEGNLAIAVSLQAMSDEVLKSFASIFADEDSMTDVFKSKDAKNKLFSYDGEDKTTSNTRKNN